MLYFFAFRYGRYIGALISCLFVGLSPIFLQRSCAGWFDTDILTLLFPLLITWTYLLSVENTARKYTYLWLAVSSLLVGLFSFTWPYWWFIFLVILLYAALSLGYNILSCFYPAIFKRWITKDEEESLASRGGFRRLGERVAYTGVFFLLSLISVCIISGTQPLIELFEQLRQALILNKPLMSSIWPNVFSTVGELRKITPQEMSGLLGGGLWVLGFSLLSIILLFIRVFFLPAAGEFKRASVIIFAAWFLSMTFASLRGVRFTVFSSCSACRFSGLGDE